MILALFCARTVKVLYGIAVAVEVSVLLALLTLLELPFRIAFCGIRSKVRVLLINISISDSVIGAAVCAGDVCPDSGTDPFLFSTVKETKLSN
jgi:hypothetical protein